MNVTAQSENDQAAHWNGTAGLAWVELQGLLDQVLAPFEDLLVEAVVERSGRQVLDVGCGTGSTTLAVARALGAAGSCVGIDISEPMIALARERAQRERSSARFICADAETYAFEPESFDTIISRFGVMFFGDFVRAFTQLRRAAQPDGELRLIAWRSAAENPFMTTAERAAAPLLPDPPPREPDAPGQFALGDEARVRRILEQSGWAEIALRPINVACAFPAKDLGRFVTRLGPLARLLRDADDATRDRIVETVMSAFDPFVHGDEVRFDAACWMIGARRTTST